MNRRRLAALVAIAAFALLFIFLPTAVGLLTDWWWYQEIGYQVVLTRQLSTQVILFLGAGLLTFGYLFGNLHFAQRGLVPDPVVFRLAPSAPRLNITAALRRLSLPAAIFFGMVAAIGGAQAWRLVLLFIHRTPFGVADPIFGRDVGYYVFTLPAIGALLGVLLGLTMLTLLLVIAIYWLRGDIILRPKQLRVEPTAGLHLAVLLAVFFVLTALRLWFVDAPGLLFSTTGPLVGASYTDMHATLPAIRISAIAALVAAVAVLVGGLRHRVAWFGLWAVGGYVALAVIGRGIYPAAIQKLVVAPTELTREAPYLQYHITATRQAWGLDSVEVRDIKGEALLTLDDIRANSATIENVRLWDREPLLQTFGQLQEIRTYYDFVSVDDDRYWIDGKYRQVLLSPRELNAASLPTRTFINEHLTFTHGMGLTLSPVNQVTTEGLPVLFVKDLPPSAVGDLRVTRPQIYFGELTNDFVIVRTRQREFDHPAGEDNVFASYEGKAGVPSGGLFRRTMLALRFGSSKILLSQDLTSESRILFIRDIMERGRKALPFLRFDRDPYMVLTASGTLKWILDAYTTTDAFPYAQPLRDGTNYMRNSVKVVIDAYDGTVTAYVAAPSDPLIRTWDQVFPGILVPIDSMPADLRAHIRYPDDLYRVQTALYTTYHMDEPETFYHREDQWQIPAVNEADAAVPFMRHIVMRLPEEPAAEFIYMVPFTPRGKDNLAAWMVARNDGDDYGKLRVYRFPRQSLVFGPKQIENRINQNTEISRQVSLWDQRGSQVIRGDLLVIPIEESLMYVQPLYLRAEGGRIPELKRVVVAYQNQVVMRETLDGALTELFGGSAAGARGQITPAEVTGAPTPTTSAPLQGLIDQARRHYDAAIQAQREGDWARYGDEIGRLGELLDQMRTTP